MNSVKKELQGKMQVIKVDVDKKKSVSNKYQIKSLPTLAIFKNGNIIWRESGMKTRAQLLNIANQYIKTSADTKSGKATEVKKKESWFKRLFG